MRKIYLLTLSSFLMGEATLPPQSPVDIGYETQHQKELLKKEIKTVKKNVTTIEKLKVDKQASTTKKTDLGPSFILNGISIKGNTTFKKEEIILFVKPYVGKKVYTKTLQEIAGKITKLYYSKGYVTSKCILPQQNVKNGNVVFQIIEDKLGSIALSGENAYEYDSRLFSKYFQKMQGKIINAQELNEKLKLLQYLPISKISPTLSQVRPGVSNLILKITEAKQRVSLSMNNMGSKFSGVYRSTITSTINNIAGISDSLFLSATTSQTPKNYTSISASYRHPVGKNGARMSWGFSQLNYQLDPNEVGSSNVFYDGDSSQFNVLYEKPFFIFDKVNLWLNLGFDYKELSSRTLQNNNGDVLIDSLDKTSVVSLGTKIDFVDKFKGYNAISLKISQAIPNLFNSMTQEDIDRKTYRMDEEGTLAAAAVTSPLKYGKNLAAEFNKIYFSALRQQYLPRKFIMKLSFNGEYTSKRIPQAYEFSTGDYGYSTSLGIYNNFDTKYINLGLRYSYTKVYEYDLNLNTTKTSYKSPIIQFNTFYENFYLALTYQLNLEQWDSNTNNLKFNLGYSW